MHSIGFFCIIGLMRIVYVLILIVAVTLKSQSEDPFRISMQGGRIYFELTSGSQQWSPDASSQWSFRIGAGANTTLFGNLYVTGKYSIAGIRHERGEDFPQTLLTYLRLGGGWMFQHRQARWMFTPILSGGHTSDRVLPHPGADTHLQFDGWGVTPGIEARYVIHNSYNRATPNISSAFWSTHFLQFEFHHTFSDRSYTMAGLSYNMFFNGYQLTLLAEYNSLARGARGWLLGMEFGFSWLRFQGQN